MFANREIMCRRSIEIATAARAIYTGIATVCRSDILSWARALVSREARNSRLARGEEPDKFLTARENTGFVEERERAWVSSRGAAARSGCYFAMYRGMHRLFVHKMRGLLITARTAPAAAAQELARGMRARVCRRSPAHVYIFVSAVYTRETRYSANCSILLR